MRALVVYESMYGSTRAIAISIAAGLSTGPRQVAHRPYCRDLRSRAGRLRSRQA
jgi:menaquinone-dependent protoporphyrinogen IX oxidase